MTKKRVVVALSGGVDSAVSALLLQQQGYEVIGAFMKCWDGEQKGCTVKQDEYWARRVASHLKIPFYRLNLVREYQEKVIEYFLQEYQDGRTPNPDIMCNSQIKFGVFFHTVMRALKPDYIATGHYVRIQNNTLLQGIDVTKDQSYFLYKISPDILDKVLFPVGQLEKKQVRTIAQKHNLPNATKKDSQGICFIGNIKVIDFLQEKLQAQKGDVVNEQGQIVGQHKGLCFYTIGQRRGVGSFGGGVPYYVIAKDKQKNQLRVGGKYDANMLSKKVCIQNTHWFLSPKPHTTYRASIRYRQKPQEVTIEQIYKNKPQYTLYFKQPVRAATQGQSAVIYDKNGTLIGGGVIV